ncbi:protein of unknown function [Mesotoga infera]|uniref:Uncharacterized protein n=1 Tax=Mesotoga infera TaxID=1236046 RepID=A0A7Z7PS13_9BACT|nr:protein of unknown function [Mesotoga infera]
MGVISGMSFALANEGRKELMNTPKATTEKNVNLYAICRWKYLLFLIVLSANIYQRIVEPTK